MGRPGIAAKVLAAALSAAIAMSMAPFAWAASAELPDALLLPGEESNGPVYSETASELVEADLAWAEIAAIPDQAFTGLAVEPALTVTYGGSELTLGTHYTVSYDDNVNCGTATVTVTGAGGCTGSASATFAITAPKESDSGLNDGTALGRVRVQVPSGFDAESDASADIRMAYGIDGLGYQSTGLLLSASADDDATLRLGEAGVSAYATQTAYSKVYSDGELTDASSVFAEDGTRPYAGAVKVTGIPSAAFDTVFYVRAFAIKDDGTVVYGAMRAFQVSANDVVQRALSWVGSGAYVYGSCSYGAFDSSGFVSYCLTGQYTRIGNTSTFMGWYQTSDPQPGCVCVSDGHTGIYLGDGLMVHAANEQEGIVIGPVQSGMIYVTY